MIITNGHYYYGTKPDRDGIPIRETQGMVTFREGILTDGSAATATGWLGREKSEGMVSVVFDLLQDYRLDRIEITLHSPDEHWGFRYLKVKYRCEAEADTYRIAAIHNRGSAGLDYAVTVPMLKQTARYVVIELKRFNAYQHIPLTGVTFHAADVTIDPQPIPEPPRTEEQLAQELRKDGLIVDKYGQWIYGTWPGKVTSDEQLRLEYEEEAERLAAVRRDSGRYDLYGGIIGERYRATGFFRLERINGKWWFITPQGNKFFLKGVDAASIWEWGYGTPFKRPDGTLKRICEELPDPADLADAYADDGEGERVSFLLANVMRKYGENYEAKWEEITRKRMIDWGFNAFSKWTRPRNISFPYIPVLQDPGGLIRIKWTYDVFDPQCAAVIEASLAGELERMKDDPWLIGYTYDNEAGWTDEIVREVLLYDSTSPAKRAFIQFFAARYGNDLQTVNRLLGTDCPSLEQLADTPVGIGSVPAADVSGYIQLASRTSFSTVRNIIRKYDANHLFLGSSVVPTWRTCPDWDAAAMDDVDAFSVDFYVSDASWISRYASFGMPLLNLEFTFSSNNQGLLPVNTETSCTSEEERGLRYKAFVEGQAADPLFVGFGWFAYYDQAVPGRKDGENFNIGLLNQQDQPYQKMIDIMRSVNAGLEEVHEGRPPE